MMPQCDGVSLDLSNGPSLQGIALLNIPYTHGGSNMWGDNTGKRNSRHKKKKKERERELSTSSFNSVDLSTAIQGIHSIHKIIILHTTIFY